MLSQAAECKPNIAISINRHRCRFIGTGSLRLEKRCGLLDICRRGAQGLSGVDSPNAPGAGAAVLLE